MKAIQKINNNVALCLDDEGRRIIAFGRGIGFGTMPKEISEKEIEQTFYKVDDSYIELLRKVPEEILRICVDAVKEANEKLSLDYSREVALGLPFTMVCSMASALLRAAGNSRTPFYAMTVSAAVNVLLDLVFVIGLKCGVAGAAWATLIAQAVSALIAMQGIFRKEPYRTNAGDWILRKDLLAEAFRLFTPMFWNSTVITAGGMYVQSHVNGAGAAFSAGFTAAIKLFNLFEAIVMAIQTALSVFIGQNLGGRQIHRINGGFYRAMAVTMGIMVFFTVCVYLFGEQMIRLFLSPKDQAAYQTAVRIACLELRYLMPSGVVMVAMFFFRAGVQALGRPNCIFVAGIVQMALRILTIVILYPVLGTTSYLLTDQTAWVASLPVVMVPFIRHMRQLERQAQCDS